MRLILISLIISIFLSTAISDDVSLFSDTEPYPYNLVPSDDPPLWTDNASLGTDNASLGTDDPPLGEPLFDEASPQLLSSDECPSGDLGWAGDLGLTGKIRRRDACRSGFSTDTESAAQTPTDPEPGDTRPSNEKDDQPESFDHLPYMPPPEFDGLGCSNLWGMVFKYTVCGTGIRADQVASTIDLIPVFQSFTVTNAVLCKYQPCPSPYRSTFHAASLSLDLEQRYMYSLCRAKLLTLLHSNGL